MNKQQGFTLIELVVVIVILGILAATAAPKFIDLTSDAKISVLQGMKGALSSGVSMIHAKALIKNQLVEEGSITTGDTTIALSYGYPMGNWKKSLRYVVNLDDISRTIGNGTICDEEWCGGAGDSIPSGKTTNGRIGKIFQQGYSWNDQCGVYYINHEDGSAPEIGIETADC